VSPRRLQRLAGLRVLMVEDNVTNQVVAQSLLAAEGAQVSLAGGGNAAVVAVRVAPASFDLVLMDIQMPDMDGYEATRRIRALPGAATLPIVAMTANALRSDREECLRAGMNAHVSKPFDLDELVKVLQQCVADTARDPLREIDGAAMARELIAQVADDAAAESAAQPAIEQLPLVAAAPAISRLGGESRTYRQALRSALRDLDRLQQELGRHAAEPRALRRSLHTLKGLCGTLGARRLQALAQASERALLRDLPVDLGSALMPVFTDTLAELRVLSATLEAAEQPPRDVQVTVPDARLAAALQELEALLLASSAQAIDFCRQVEAMAAPEHAAALASICEATQQLDFPIAARQCRELIDQLTGQEARSP
jgi:two-component system, sensor histidine kinase and response regulator